MNRPVHALSVPAELKAFEPSCLLPGERESEFELVRQMIIEDIAPRTNIEWLWSLDLVELSKPLVPNPIVRRRMRSPFLKTSYVRHKIDE
jgi:hypothetical protein